jgi:hypothetical protein
MLLIGAVAAVAAHGEERPADTMRQKLQAKIIESFPLLETPKPSNEEKASEHPCS